MLSTQISARQKMNETCFQWKLKWNVTYYHQSDWTNWLFTILKSLTQDADISNMTATVNLENGVVAKFTDATVSVNHFTSIFRQTKSIYDRKFSACFEIISICFLHRGFHSFMPLKYRDSGRADFSTFFQSLCSLDYAHTFNLKLKAHSVLLC